MKSLLSARTLAASLGVLMVGALAAPAMAFDDVDWNWKKRVKENVDIDVYIDVDVESTGLVELENLQIFLGTVKAESYVHDIDNNPFYKENEHHKDYYVPDEKKHRPPVICAKSLICTAGLYDDKKRRKDDGWDKIPVKPLDARYELPIVLSSATAVGNNASITSDVPVFLHSGQYVADVKGGYKPRDGGGSTGTLADAWKSPGCMYARIKCERESGNAFVDLAEDFLKDAKDHKLAHAKIEAISRVWDIKNASVDSSATAVANNVSITLASDVDGVGKDAVTPCKDKKCDSDRLSNHIVIADNTQFALANVHAKSSVYDISATGYDHMRQLETETLSQKEGDPGYTIKVPTPWISSVATAVGNNISINVGRDLTPAAGGSHPPKP